MTKITDPRMGDMTAYLAAQASSLRLKEVLQTGGLVDWGWLESSQYTVASDGLATLEQAGIPYLLTVGNHDTRAVGVGELDAVFTAAREGGVAGQFEPGKLDNASTTFTAGGKQWLTLSLGFCPRVAAVDRAKSVVAAHPDANVIVETHYHLDGYGSIGANNQGYGATSPQYLDDNLISQYANVKLIFSGHTGVVAAREDTGVTLAFG